MKILKVGQTPNFAPYIGKCANCGEIISVEEDEVDQNHVTRRFKCRQMCGGIEVHHSKTPTAQKILAQVAHRECVEAALDSITNTLVSKAPQSTCGSPSVTS